MAWQIRSAQRLIPLLLLALCLGSVEASASSLPAYVANLQGLLHFKQKQYYKSYQDFLRAMAKDPLNPDLQMNLGLSLALGEDWEKAEKAFLAAQSLAAGDSQRLFMARFNLGVVRGQKGDIDGALQAYQSALDIEPESLEVKTNIELLLQGQQGQSSKSGKKGGKGDDKKDQKDKNGDDDKDKDKKDKDKDDQNQQNKDKQYQQPRKQQPKPFQSKDLGKEDVRKILNEIENQEQSIRAKEYDKGAKERRNDKDW